MVAGNVRPLGKYRRFRWSGRSWNSEDDGIDKPVDVAFRGDIEFVDADVEAIMVHCKMRKIRDTRSALVWISRQRGIQGVN